MPLKITVTIVKGKDVPKKLRRVQARLHRRQEPLVKIKSYLVNRWYRNFLSEGAEYEPWEPLSPVSDPLHGWSLRRDPTDGPYVPILFWTGDLFANVIDQSDAGRVSTTNVEWVFRNTAPSYPISHQVGWNPIADQTPRIIWKIDDQDEDTAHREMSQWVAKVIRGGK